MNFNTVDVVYPPLVPFLSKTVIQKIIMIQCCVSATFMITAVFILYTDDAIIYGILSLFAAILHGNLAGILWSINDFSNPNWIAKIIITLSAIIAIVIGFSAPIYSNSNPELRFIWPVLFLIAIIWTVIIYTGIGVSIMKFGPLSQTGRNLELLS